MSENTDIGSPQRRGLMLVLSAPSGVGKTTLQHLLLKQDPHIVQSTSVTTRKIRTHENAGRDYIFTDERSFEQMVEKNEFLEHAKVHGNYYGTPKTFVKNKLEQGMDVLFDLDWQGHRQLASTIRSDVTSVFILPPSKEELVKRLRERDNGISNDIKKRLDQINLEISHWHEYDYVIVNSKLEESVQKLMTILKAERLRKNRRTGLPHFVSRLIKETFTSSDL
jgi:guanylate kinase